MKNGLVVSLLSLFLCSSLLAEQNPVNRSTALVFNHVNVIDATGAPSRRNMVVVITGARITGIGKSGTLKIPKDAQTIDARGKFLLPGFWDSHVHTLWDAQRPARFFPLFLANGVTSVREMGGPMSAAEQVRWRDRIVGHDLFGPRLFVPGPFVDGPRPAWPGSIAISSEAEARHAVDELKQAGVDFIKVYSQVPRDAYFALADEARKQGLPFLGHVPFAIGVDEASDSGQKSIEHLNGILIYCSSKREDVQAQMMKGANINQLNDTLVDTYAPAKCTALFERFVKNGTWQVPTLTIRRARPFLLELQTANDPRLKYMPRAIADSWKRDDPRQPGTPEAIASRKRLYRKEVELVGAMHLAGVKFLAGSDTPNPYCFPGFSLHDELQLLVEAGLSPLEALQTATRNPALFMGVEKDLGTIESGKIADLVLLDANPLANIKNTRRMAAVVVNGRCFPKSELQKMLSDVEAAATKQ